MSKSIAQLSLVTNILHFSVFLVYIPLSIAPLL